LLLSEALPRYCSAPPVQGSEEQPLLWRVMLSAYATDARPSNNAGKIVTFKIVFIFPPEIAFVSVLR
jgi:hypothetical protein